MPDGIGDLPQDPVARLVAVGIIDRFESVRVDQQQIGGFQVQTGQQQIIAGAVIH